MYIDVTKAKFQELIDAVKAKNKETENKLVWCLALIGGALIVALIAYAVYRFLTPDYYDDYDDDDFDDDFDDFEDDDDFEEVEEAPAEKAADTEEEAPAEEAPAEEAAEEETAEA
jgi:hypothetical protein